MKRQSIDLPYFQNITNICVGYTSFLRLGWLNLEWNMIFLVCKTVIHVSTLYLSLAF